MSSSPRVALCAALLATALFANAARGAPAPPVAPPSVHLPLLSGGAIADPDLAAVAEAARGLLYPSETDAPLVPFTASPNVGTSPSDVCTALAAGDAVRLQDAGAFLAAPARVMPWMSPQELAAAARFAELRRVFLTRMALPVACLVGDTEVVVYVLGRSATGAVVGLRTVVVET